MTINWPFTNFQHYEQNVELRTFDTDIKTFVREREVDIQLKLKRNNKYLFI